MKYLIITAIIILVGCAGEESNTENVEHVAYTFIAGTVYKFKDDGNICYFGSMGIHCIKETKW